MLVGFGVRGGQKAEDENFRNTDMIIYILCCAAQGNYSCDCRMLLLPRVLLTNFANVSDPLTIAGTTANAF